MLWTNNLEKHAFNEIQWINNSKTKMSSQVQVCLKLTTEMMDEKVFDHHAETFWNNIFKGQWHSCSSEVLDLTYEVCETMIMEYDYKWYTCFMF